MKKITILILVVIIATAGYFFVNKNFSDDNSELQKIKVRLSWKHQGQFAGFYVAKEKGWYEDLGLDVEFLEAETGVDQPSELSERGVAFSIMSIDELIVGVSEGEDLAAVAVIYQVNPLAIAASKESGIESPADFRGKKLGNSGGDLEGRLTFKAMANFVNLKEEELEIVELDFNTVENLRSGKVDALDLYRFDQTYLLDKIGFEYKIIKPEKYGFNRSGDAIVAERSFIDENNEIVANFVEASIRGWEEVFKDIEKSTIVTLKYTKGDYDNADYQRHIIKESEPLITGSFLETGSIDINNIVESYLSLRASGVLKEDIDLSRIYNTKFTDE